MFIEAILIIAVTAFLLYRRTTAKFDFFKNRNIPYAKAYPFMGSFKGMFLKKESLLEELIRYHNQFKKSKIYGVFQVSQPLLVINDLDLIKQITVKDFNNFVNHRHLAEHEDDPLFANSIFAMKNDRWKDMRSTLSPAFTGSKMRMMFELINETCNQAVKYLKDLSKDKPEGIDLEMKDFFTLYTNDVIASTAFGINVNSLENKNNEFYLMGKQITSFTTWKFVKFTLQRVCKPLCKLLNIKTYDPVFANYFNRLVLDAMKYRTEHNIIRPDMINILMEARVSQDKPHNREWTDTEIVAQCFFFFFAGFESIATALSFTSHEIMENREVQRKLLAEIDEVKTKLNGKPLTYEVLQGMKYLDMVISETLRKWPPNQATDRACINDYTLKTDDIEYEVKSGELIWIPIVGLHHDERNFPNPKKFNPERFSDENKDNIKPSSYIPFGVGPRSCIAQRLALMEAKAILYYILCNFTLESGEKTNIPLKLAPTAFPLKSLNGFWMKLLQRQ